MTFTKELISIMSSIWYIFILAYFILFSKLFHQCAKSILRIKYCLDINNNGKVYSDINKLFLKKSLREIFAIKQVDLLNNDIRNLLWLIEKDNNTDLIKYYNNLINSIFFDYTKRKQKEIKKILTKGGICRNQEPWLYNLNCEIQILDFIIDEKNTIFNDDSYKIIFNFMMELLSLNITRAQIDGYDNISVDKIACPRYKVDNKTFGVSEWKELTLKLYKISSDNVKQFIVKRLQNNYYSRTENIVLYNDECVKELIRSEVYSVFEGKRNAEEFCLIYKSVLEEKSINDYYTDLIIDALIGYNKFEAEKMVELLNKVNCTYVFKFIILYYSIYKFRFDWKYINVSVLNTLWKNHGSLQDDADEIIKKIKNSRISHRFEENIYNQLVKCLYNNNMLNEFHEFEKDKTLNLFYIWVIKTEVINKGVFGSYYKNDICKDNFINIINELAKHEELLTCKYIEEWLPVIQYRLSNSLDGIPKKLKVTLRSLLLINMDYRIIVDAILKKEYYAECFGEYLLIKVQELSDAVKKNEKIKKIIKKAFLSSKLNIENYLGKLEKECILCNCEINETIVLKMKEYLLEL